MGTDVEMAKDEWALHETLELHELLAFKNVCMTKSVTMPVLVSDESLKELMAASATMDRHHIADLQALLSKMVPAEAYNSQ